MKNIQFVLDDNDYIAINEIKNRSGLSWGVFVMKAAESYGGTVLEDSE